MTDIDVHLSGDERTFLVRLLETAAGETRVEIRHTDSSPPFKEGLENEYDLIRGILDRLRREGTVAR